MKIKINQKSLLAALNKMNAFLRSSEPIILSVQNKCLYLYGGSIYTNVSSEVKITTKAEDTGLEIIEKSTIKINFGALLKAIRESEHELLEIKTTNLEELRLVILSSGFEIDLFAKETVYKPGFSKGSKVGKFKAEYLGNLFKEVTYSISKSKSRPLFTNVHFECSESKLLIEATDSYCMARHTTETSSDNEFDLLIPDIISKNINKFFGKEGNISIETHEKNICFKSKGLAIQWEASETRYPDTQRLIPDSQEMSIYEIDLKLFKVALTRIIKLSDSSPRNTVIKLEFSKNTVQLITDNMGFSLFNYHQEIPLLSEGEELTLGVNPNYILTAIKHLPKDSQIVKVAVQGKYKPFIVESEISSNTLHLATPIRIG